jgi:hypothetical protein
MAETTALKCPNCYGGEVYATLNPQHARCADCGFFGHQLVFMIEYPPIRQDRFGKNGKADIRITRGFDEDTVSST